MAGIITHLEIANRIINTLPDGIIKDKGLFYAGSIAPDLIRMREGVVRADKKHSHMRDNIADLDFNKKENLSTFYNRVTNFINDNMSKESNINDLYRGYVVHILSDERFLLKVRPDFVMDMHKLGIVPTDILFRDKIFYDLDSHDFRLLEDNNELKEICTLLKDVELHSVHDFITEEEISRGIDWVIEKYINKENEVSEPIYISNNKISAYIDETANNIISRLSDGVMFPRIF
ncbi:zinc dependent phospholipase C family protein [Oceanirhabdus sp. W0125-5]|uniref:zinc dependent phospholipase C family protein n=1 Tax=Oceanirhabdus sp. W0125-5 TaxID=2999116 RepID=UPI0022F31DC2|nr:zinc dependent phospholipase C family protein [Oceanirhabdus sp. W0125-5]WBW96203.1 zinc dependent phospholipase C family protein [Oceanirhabdus sp. W0125-5]